MKTHKVIVNYSRPPALTVYGDHAHLNIQPPCKGSTDDTNKASDISTIGVDFKIRSLEHEHKSIKLHADLG